MPAWHAHVDVWLLLGGLWLAYLLAVRRHRPATTAEREERGRRTVLFSVGMGLLLLASEYPIHDLAEGYLYFVHMIQHMLFTLVAAPLLIAGIPAWMWRVVLSPRLDHVRRVEVALGQVVHRIVGREPQAHDPRREEGRPPRALLPLDLRGRDVAPDGQDVPRPQPSEE